MQKKTYSYARHYTGVQLSYYYTDFKKFIR